MVDQLSMHNQVLREALALAAKDSPAAIRMLAALLEGALTPAEQASIAKHAGAISQGIGELQRAVDFYRQAATADPSDPYIHLALGQLYQELGQVEDARAMLELCLTALKSGVDQDLLDVATRALNELNAPSDKS